MARVLRIDRTVPSNWEEALDEFLLSKKAQGASPRTVKDYQYHIGLFFARYPEAWEGGSALKTAVLKHLSQPIATATFNIRRKYLKSFFNWCVSEGIFPKNPLAGIPKRKDEGRIRVIRAEALKKLLELPNQKTYTGLRDYCLILLTLDIGIRPQEALSLRLWDVDLENAVLTLRKEITKNRKPASLPLSPPTVEALRRLIRARHPSWPKDAPLFCTRDGAPFTVRRWQARMRMYSERLGVEIRPYDLRHAFGTLFIRNGGNPLVLQKLLRHSSMEMVKKYVHLAQEDLKKEHEFASPANRLLPRKPRMGKVRD